MLTAPDRAQFASSPELSRGRFHAEPESATRTCFQRDRDRIVHSAAFRRLEYKTQVFVNHEGDYYRTRLTHSLEVAQIARSIARSLRLDEDLAEALALAHDLGHPPFGHAGEDALSDLMQPFGGFDHNAQSLKVVTLLEERYPEFDGLNLTWETLEGIVKHNGPLTHPDGSGEVARDIADYVARHDLELHTHAGPEAQAAALADDIAYNNHDIDDGLRAGLFTVADISDVPMVGDIFKGVDADYPGLDPARRKHEAIRRMIGMWVGDALAESKVRLDDAKPGSAEAVRALKRPVIGLSERMRDMDGQLKAFLMEHMYRHYRVNRMTSKARRVVRALFNLLIEEPDSLPTDWRAKAGPPGSERTARLVGDYIAGMTDRFALDEYARLIDVQAGTA